MLALLSLCLTAYAESLPGVSVPFSVDAQGRWVLAPELPDALSSAGVAPGWVLLAVDGRPVQDPLATQRQVAAGPAREVQLLFQLPAPPPVKGKPPEPPGETVLVVSRRPLIQVNAEKVQPWPDGFALGTGDFQATDSGMPLLQDASGSAWVVDPATGGQARTDLTARGATTARGAQTIPEVWWTLTEGEWVIDDGRALQTGDTAWAKTKLTGAIRLRSYQGQGGDHLLLPTTDGLQVWTVDWPTGTPDLPVCTPQIPETCLASGKQILTELGSRPGATDEALRHLNLACTSGVYRACYEAVAVTTPDKKDQVEDCLEGKANACQAIAKERLADTPPAPEVVGLLEYACQTDASGSLGDRLRRLESVGEGCMLLAEGYDRLSVPDRALLSLDQACVLGRDDACKEAEERRYQAYALRMVRECEDTEVPVGSSCVELGQLLQERPIAAATLDDFGAFLRACTLGDETGCMRLGDYVDRWGIENTRVIAAENDLLQSCALGEQRACLGGGYLLVRHEPRSDAYAKALELFSNACEKGLSSACIAGAKQRRIGSARRVEAPAQLELWELACDQDNAEGCAGLGERQARSKKTWTQAFEAWTLACSLGDAHACTELGKLVKNRRPEPWPKEEPSEAYLKRGCDNGDPEGCFTLAEVPRKEDPVEASYKLLERSCEGDFGPGCAALAAVHLNRKTSFDDEIAARHLESACDNGHYESCKVLGGMYQRGKGVERDRQRARELLQRFRANAQRRYVRVGANVGFPAVAAGGVELVLPIPIGPALSVSGSGSFLPSLGAPLMLLEGLDTPAQSPDLQYMEGLVRFYPSNKARGLYAAAGWHQFTAEGGSLQGTLTRSGFSARLGIHSESRGFYTRLEGGLAQYGVINLADFDEDKTGTFPLIQPVVSFSFGLALF